MSKRKAAQEGIPRPMLAPLENSPGIFRPWQDKWAGLVDAKTGAALIDVVRDPLGQDVLVTDIDNVDFLDKVRTYYDWHMSLHDCDPGLKVNYNLFLPVVHRRLCELSEMYELQTLIIKTKEGTLQRMVLNPIQRRMYTMLLDQAWQGYLTRLILVKARQWGGSTLIEELIYVRTKKHKGTNGLVIAHEIGASTNLFNMYKRFYENDITRREGKPTKDSLEFKDKEGGLIEIKTGYTEGSGASYTINYLHISEATLFRNLKGSFAFVMNTVPGLPNSGIFVEATPQGMDSFRDMYNNKDDYLKFFAPWFEHPEYRKEFDSATDKAKFEKSLLEEEAEDRKRFKLELEQLYWYRSKLQSIEFLGDKDRMNEQYPKDDVSCFLATGGSFFNFSMAKHNERVADMNDRDAVSYDRKFTPYGLVPEKHASYDLKDAIVSDPFGKFVVYKPPRANVAYFVGADIAEGVDKGLDPRSKKRDNTVAEVISVEYVGGQLVVEQCAELVCQEPPETVAKLLKIIARLYNSAWVAPERNGYYGVVVIRELRKIYKYVFVMPVDLLEEATAETMVDHEDAFIRYGWQTGPITRPIMLSKLSDSLRDADTFKVYSKLFMDEVSSFFVNKNGKPMAKPGYHDDTIMGMGIAIQCYLHSPKYANIVDQGVTMDDNGVFIMEKIAKMKPGDSLPGMYAPAVDERDSFGFKIKK